MISSFLILCITALFLSSIISYEKRKQVISLVNLLPDSMVKKHIIRFTIYYGAAMLSLVMPFLIVSILVIIKNGLGDFRYPVGTIIGQEIRILPMYEYLFQSFLFLLLWVLFLSTISFLLSALFEHSLVNLLGTLLCLFLAEYRLFSSIGWIESISHYLPTSYVDFQNVIIGGDIFSPLASEQVTFMNGILTLGIWSIVLLFIGMGTIYIKKSY